MNFVFDYKTSLIDENDLLKIQQKLLDHITFIKQDIQQGYDSNFAFAYVPKDQNNLIVVNELVQKKLNLNISTLIVIGIGGSNLGTIAVHELINGKLYNQQNPKIKIYFADTVDSDYLHDLYNLVENELRSCRNVLINLISKSGTTLESIAIFELFIELLKKYKYEKYNEYIVLTTDKGSFLWDYAHEIDCSVLQIPSKVGGRFSVLTSVGLFPLAMLSLEGKQLLQGANDMNELCLQTDFTSNFSILSACILFYHYINNKININDIFLFSLNAESLGKWMRQLMSESLGKETEINGQKMNVGITPTISIGSTDLHSALQLNLAGPKDKFTTFIKFENNKFNLRVPKIKEFTDKFNEIQLKTFNQIMNSIFSATQRAYEQNQRPFTTISIFDKSEYNIGQFMQFKMYETIYLAYLLNINPFDQPNIEFYKKTTKNLLENI